MNYKVWRVTEKRKRVMIYILARIRSDKNGRKLLKIIIESLIERALQTYQMALYLQ